MSRIWVSAEEDWICDSETYSMLLIWYSFVTQNSQVGPCISNSILNRLKDLRKQESTFRSVAANERVRQGKRNPLVSCTIP